MRNISKEVGMSYTALYRKFRPGEFEDVKGQDHIVTTLKNQIKSDRVGHAYLFCGTRGTGKTTVAKILAKAVNCESSIEGSPCGECKMCVDIQSGASLNVIEIDAASNNGVEHIRTIREEVEYRPPNGRYKVYIIDEVHMLTTGAFNALLKTLEEPPEYVVFILATTELHKIPITILSRCQHYDFKRITIDTIANRLEALMDAEKIEVEEKALRYVAKMGDGSMRDALSLLDQCIAFHMGETLTYDHVLEVLGVVDTLVFSKLIRQVVKSDLAGALATVEELIMQGREINQLVNDFVWYMRNLLLVKSSEGMEEILDVSTENMLQLKEESQIIEMVSLLRYIRIFSELSNQVKVATQRRVLLEVAFIKLCKPEMEQDLDSVTERVRQVEDKVEKGIATTKVVYENASAEEPKEEVFVPQAIPEEVKEIARNFQTIVNHVEAVMMRSYLRKAKISVSRAGRLLIVLETSVAANHLRDDVNSQYLQDAIIEVMNKKVELEVAFEEVGKNTYVDISKMILMDIEQE